MGAIYSSLFNCCPKNRTYILNEQEGEEVEEDQQQQQTKPHHYNSIDIKLGNNIVKKQINPEDLYEEVKKLGEGAFGKVILGRHRQSNELRAIKIIKKENLQDEISDNQIENEINILKSLDHSNILKVYEYFDYCDSLYIVNEYIGDGDLFSLIDREKFLKEPISLQILYQLLSAISYIHSNNIFHGDIKPENIMIERMDKVRINKETKDKDLLSFSIKLIDFGTSKIFNRRKVFHNLIGTANYVAPEVVFGGYNKQCDIWSSGVVLYVMLFGEFPFDGETDEEVFSKIKNSFPEIEKKVVSQETKDLLRRMLEKDPYERISASDALVHKAFKDIRLIQEEEKKRIFSNTKTKTVFHNLKNSKSIKFNQAVTAFITHNFLSKEISQKYKNIFKAIDINNDGKVTAVELREGFLKSGFFYSQDEVDSIIEGIDRDNNGYIECEEFISASADLNVLLSENNVKYAFETLDVDGSGFISFEEIGKFIYGDEFENNKLFVENIIVEAGKDPSKEIGFEDFKDILLCLKRQSSIENEE